MGVEFDDMNANDTYNVVSLPHGKECCGLTMGSCS